jgi:hypothetical protein
VTASQLRARAYRQRIRTLIRDKRISSGARFLWVLIESFADTNGWNCFPSVPTLAEESGHDETWVKRKLCELKAKGFVSVGKRKTPQGWVNEYTLLEGEGTVQNTP